MRLNGSSTTSLRRLLMFDTIRKKTLAILAATFLSSFLLLHAVSQYVLLQNFKELEIHTARHCLSQIGKKLDASLEVLDTINRDWAWWDDVCAFVAKPNPEFIATNLTDETLANLKLDFMGFFATDGGPVRLISYDRQRGKKVGISAEILDFFKTHPELLRHANAESVRKGIVIFPQGPMLFVSRPILTSTRQGPVQGALVFGRALDAREIERIAQSEEVFLKVAPLAEAQKNPRQLEIIKKIQASGENMAVFTHNGAKSLTGALLIDDPFGNPALLMEASLQRSVYEQGQRAISVLGWLFFGVSAAVCLVMMLLLDRLVVRPVVVLSNAVSERGEGAGAEITIGGEGPMEIKRLAAVINTMLAKVERANHLLTGKNAQLEQEIGERKELEQEREKLIAQLQEALSQVKTLSGFLPICASCKKIRDDSGYWKQIESYLSAHADVTFSHGICPDCAKKLYGEFIDVDEVLKKK